MLHGPRPGLQEIRSEREDVPGAGKIMTGKLVHPKDLSISRAKRLRCKGLVAYHSPSQRADPIAQQIGECAAPRTRDCRHLAAGRSQLGRQTSDSIVPGDLPPGAV